ncbi:leucine-rich repeat-containing protein 19 [Microcaecilia unicolor]|uniref:Leucine-rich repeat-containing protein 19 n=1 Tax=Microcaecilia unicolor TaxID=1415580 RepID=A0A6P7XBZ1_9AMPH|nr:leucine-rich repeat-containing protein 19 [Microcaecilia unicolor]
MKIIWLVIIVTTVPYSSSECNITPQSVVCKETWMGLSSIPDNLPQNVSILYLNNNNISFNATDNKILQKYVNLTELYLSDNKFTKLPEDSFSQLTKLKILNLRNNSINIIETNAFRGLNYLINLDLGNNRISQLTIAKDLHVENLTLDGNPWNCNCSLLSLENWLNFTKAVTANENITVCVSPVHMANISIKNACLTADDLSEPNSTLPSTTLPASTDKQISSVNFKNTSSQTGTFLFGNTWKFILGVIVVALATALLILLAVKVPIWYKYVISYNHQRLEEDTFNMFEEEFTIDKNSKRTTSNREEDDSIVVFEQMHAFATDDDGFIEDKYIDAQDLSIQS